MLLTVDVGNTNIKLGLFDDERKVSFTLSSLKNNNYRSLILSFIYKSNLREDNIDKAVFSCVVPSVYNDIYDALTSIVGNNIIDIDYRFDYGIKLAMPHPEECGDDLIVMCANAYRKYHREILVVSMGTCSVICHVNKDGEFKHCIILPGFDKYCETLWNSAALLGEAELEYKDSLLANNTVDAMSVGIYNGYINMLGSLIEGVIEEIKESPYIIGCGGMGKKIVPYLDLFDEYDPDFVTDGLHYIGRRY